MWVGYFFFKCCVVDEIVVEFDVFGLVEFDWVVILGVDIVCFEIVGDVEGG